MDYRIVVRAEEDMFFDLKVFLNMSCKNYGEEFFVGNRLKLLGGYLGVGKLLIFYVGIVV